MKEYHVINILEGIYEDYIRDNDKEYMERNVALTEAVKALTEIQQYRAIGTVEECWKAREKQRAKKPNKREDKYTDLIQHYSCPVCGRYFGQAGVHSVILFDKPKYCTCGNAIDWSDAD